MPLQNLNKNNRSMGMETYNNYAIYYPAIEFQNYEWLWSAALLWDRIYRIVPSNYEPDDPINIRILCEDGEIGIPIRPDNYAKEIADEFIIKLNSEDWNAAALELNVPDDYAKLHKDKVDVKLRELIISKGSAASYNDWLYIPVEFEALYMTYLAKSISERNNLQLLSDSSAAWTGSTYFHFNGNIEDFPSDNLLQQLITLVIRDFIPSNILDIKPEELLKFRRKYKDERCRFLSAVKKGAKQISDCDDPTVIQDHIEDMKKEIETALNDYRKSLKILNIVGLTGIKSLSFPVLTNILTKITGNDLDPTTLVVLSTMGIGLGLVSGLSNLRHKRKNLLRESDYSYLLHLNREWKGRSRYNHDYNFFLYSQMEEFIND